MAQYGAPDFAGNILQGLEAGYRQRQRSKLAELDEKGRQLAGEVMGGNTSKLVELTAVNPEMGMRMRQFTDQQKKDFIQDFARQAYGADSPEKWKVMVDGYRQQGHQFDPGEDDFGNRDSLISRAIDIGDRMQMDMQALKLNEPTSDVKEYNLAKSQGFTGTFMDYQTGLKQAGANNVNINNAPAQGETSYQKSIGEQLAKRWGALAEEGDAAQEELSIVGQLRNVMPQNGGLLTGIAAKAAEWGIGGEGMSDIQATQALIDRLTPKQRVPGSGTFKSGMPSLFRTAEGNAIIMDTMESLALYRQARGNIAYQVMDGSMTRAQAVEAFRKLPDPFAAFKAYRKRVPAGQDRGGAQERTTARPATGQSVGSKGDMGASNARKTKSGIQWRAE